MQAPLRDATPAQARSEVPAARMMSAGLSGLAVTMCDVTAASRSAEDAAALSVAGREYRHVAVIRIGSSPARLAGIAPVLANLVSGPRRADDSEVADTAAARELCPPPQGSARDAAPRYRPGHD